MSTELQMLCWSLLLGLVHIFLAAGASTKQRGLMWNLSSRNEPMPPLKGIAGRLSRASENFKETFPLFLAAVVIVQFLNGNSPTSALGAQIYFFARALYLPIYAFDVKIVRTLIWCASLIGILMVLFGSSHLL